LRCESPRWTGIRQVSLACWIFLVLGAGSHQDLDVAFEAIRREKADALVVGSDGWFTDHRVHLPSFAARDKVPTIYYDRAFARIGGLVS
jgi:putative ABC transport system substrate-binding protein